MRKLPIILLCLVIIFLSFLTLRLPPFSLAACSPPDDYSDCPTARTGPKIAGNTDPDNYVKIRQEYNAVGYTNQWIPTTVIYQVETPYEVLRDNLAEMKKNGLLPIIRPWDSTNEENIKRFAGDLNRALSEVSFPQKVILYAFNEPNLPKGPYRADPKEAAKAISALIQGAGANPIYKIYLPPIAGHQSGKEYNFAKEILNHQMPDGRTIGQAIKGAAFTVYQWEPGQFQADLDSWVNLLRSYGVNQFIISELGPYNYNRPDHLLQNQSDLPTWIAKMSEIFQRIKTDPSFLSEASFINTSFFLDINGDGEPDITLLVIIHEDGTVEVITVPLEGSIYWSGWEEKYGACQADRPFTASPQTKGQSFIVKVTSCFWSPQDPAQTIEALLKAINLDFPDNKKIAENLHQITLPKLTPFAYTPAVLKRSTLGKITYEVCEEGTSNWLTVEKEVEFKTPEWVEEMATTGKELSQMLVPAGAGAVLGEKTSPASSSPPLLASKEILLAQGGERKLQLQAFITVVNGQIEYKLEITNNFGASDISADIEWPGGKLHIGGPDNGTSLSYGSPGSGAGWTENNSPIPLAAGIHSITFVVTYNGPSDEQNHADTSCQVTINPDGTGTSNCGVIVPPSPPPPRKCEAYTPVGGGVVPEIVCVAGECRIKGIHFSNPLAQIAAAITQKICPSKTFIITPQIFTPHTQPADTFLRPQTLSIFKPSESSEAEKVFEFEHALEDAKHEFAASPGEIFPSETEIYGQRGVKDAYDFVQKLLSPYGFIPGVGFVGAPTPQEGPTTLTYSIDDFRNPNITISEAAKDSVIKDVLASWPYSKIESDWDLVYNSAVANVWNPAFVIALWIEESGASGVAEAWDLGCTSAPKNSLLLQLNCLFNRPYANESFEEFMCMYSEGPEAPRNPCVFTTNPNFPGNLKNWYDRLTQ